MSGVDRPVKVVVRARTVKERAVYLDSPFLSRYDEQPKCREIE